MRFVFWCAKNERSLKYSHKNQSHREYFRALDDLSVCRSDIFTRRVLCRSLHFSQIDWIYSMSSSSPTTICLFFFLLLSVNIFIDRKFLWFYRKWSNGATTTLMVYLFSNRAGRPTAYSTRRSFPFFLPPARVSILLLHSHTHDPTRFNHTTNLWKRNSIRIKWARK